MKKGFNPRQPNRNAYYEFLNKALPTIRRIKDKDIKEQRRQGEQLLKSNLDKLDDKFSKMLRSWAKAELSTVEPEEAQRIAGSIHNFCTYIAQFPLIKPEIKWEIVITGCQVATTVFTREAYLTDWLMSQNLLGIAYRNQGRIDEAIAIFKGAVEIYSPEVFFENERYLDKWTTLQNSLGNAYWSRSQSQQSPEEKLRNLNLALAAYEKALQGTSKDESPDDWARTKYNICDVYGKMGKTADAIICYKQALEVFPEKTYEWAQAQHGLGRAYSNQRNIDQAIDCFRLALKIFTPTAYPEDCCKIGRSLGYVAYSNRRWQEASEGYGIAIEALEQQINIWATTDAQRPDFTHLFAIQNPTKDLDYSDIEVQAIKQYFHSSHILVKGDAKKSAIDNQQLQTAHCIHFSCHCDFDFERPLLSKLHLADCHISPKNDPATAFSKYLTVLELFTFDLSQCRLVTLSACETGLINFPSATDEYIGLNYGFLVAGTASIVCSLWTVNELSTALLIIRFYQNLKSGSTVPIALNQAQIWLRNATKEQLQDWAQSLPLSPAKEEALYDFFCTIDFGSKPFESPYYWAAFCAIGQ